MRNGEGILLNQKKYIEDLLIKTKCEQAKVTPLEVSTKLETQGGDELSDPGKHRRLVAKLIYLTVTRPDMSYVVSVVSQFIQKPQTFHWNVVIRILKYLKNTTNRGLFYKKGRNSLEVQCLVDYDWAGNTFDRRSTSGFFIAIRGCGQIFCRS